MGLVAFEADDQAHDLAGELVGVADGAAGAVGEGLEAMLLVAVEDFVAGFTRNSELAAQVGHALAVQQPGNEPQAFFHDRTLLPGHWHLPPAVLAGRKCYPCVRYDLSPMSRVAHLSNSTTCTLLCNRCRSLATRCD